MRKMTRVFVTCAVAGAFAVAVVVGCGGDTNNNTTVADNDASLANNNLPGQACTPNMKECVNDALARVCPTDGSGWLSVPCGAGSKCTGGACVADVGAKCTPGDGACANDTTALDCKPDGQGFAQVTCPPKTTCTGKGKCVGACVVGNGTCEDIHTVRICADGQSTTLQKCADGQLCVDVGDGVAACKPAACTPDPYGCDYSCGNKNDPAADQTKFRTHCVASPAGYNYVADACATGTTCNPDGASCGGGKHQAACQGDCTPGAMRCASNNLGTQTCGNDGKWESTVTSCNPATATNYVCMTSPADPSKVVCGDPVCSSYSGTCTTDGQYRACGADGRLGAPAACAKGICTATGGAVGGVVPGACQAQCQTGDERCISSTTQTTSYQSCTATGTWGPTQNCASFADGGPAYCIDYTNSVGRPARLCGAQCSPGTHRCTAADGGVGNDGIETCSASGFWGAAAACTVGACQPVGGSDAACVADCVPGTKICVGPNKQSDNPSIVGKEAEVTCTAQGKIPSAPDCAGDPATPGCCQGTQTCRKNSSGEVLGCVQCVGSVKNEQGVTDTRCTDPAGDAAAIPAGSSETCTAANAWGAPSACPTNTSCYRQATSCTECFGGPCTATYLGTIGKTCTDAQYCYYDYWSGTICYGSTPTACGTPGDKFYVSDCCVGYAADHCETTSYNTAVCR